MVEAHQSHSVLYIYNQHKQESHGGLPDYQKPFDHMICSAPSNTLGKTWDDVIKSAPKHGISGFPNLRCLQFVVEEAAGVLRKRQRGGRHMAGRMESGPCASGFGAAREKQDGQALKKLKIKIRLP